MSDIPVPWKKIARGGEYPDRRIKAVLFTMASSGIRLGAWDYLRWGHIRPIEREGKIVAAKMTVYAGDDEEYLAFITPEAYFELEKWMSYRSECGESINENSWVMRHLWNITFVCHCDTRRCCNCIPLKFRWFYIVTQISRRKTMTKYPVAFILCGYYV